LLLSLALSGCAAGGHVIGYDIVKPALAPPNLGQVYISTLRDERPKPERLGRKGKMLTFSSRDAHFSKDVAEAVTEVLTKELENSGLFIVAEKDLANYKISGSLKHFQAIMSPAKITFLPYLGAVSSLWTKDDFTIALSIYIKMSNRSGKTLINKIFDVSEDLKLPTGLLSLARYSRGFNYKLKLMDEALKDVIGQIREEILSQVKQ
jgi:hypothetical protein